MFTSRLQDWVRSGARRVVPALRALHLTPNILTTVSYTHLLRAGLGASAGGGYIDYLTPGILVMTAGASAAATAINVLSLIHILLRDVRGWSSQRYEQWLTATLLRLLLSSPHLDAEPQSGDEDPTR